MRQATKFSLFLLIAALTAIPTEAKPAQPEEFVSLLGRFGIMLPSNYADYRSFLTLEISGQKFSGNSYNWLLDHDQAVVSYADGPIDLETSTQAGAFLTSIRDEFIRRAVPGSVIGERKTSLQGHPGLIFVIESSAGRVMGWVYLVRNRFYLLSLSLSDASKTEEHVKTLSTFRVLTKSELEPRFEKLVENLTPLPVPQEPTMKRGSSDATDFMLKSRVKQIVTEGEPYFGTTLLGDRARLSIDDYDLQGNLVKTVLYSGDLPMAVRLYGYIDGQRAYREMRKYPDLVLATSDPKKKDHVTKPSAPEPKVFKIKYKYDSDGHVIEKQVLQEDGAVWEKVVYKPKEGKIELTFDSGLPIFGPTMDFAPDKVVSVLDENGNPTEDTLISPDGADVDVRSVGGQIYKGSKPRFKTEKLTYKYELDKQGNWIKRITLRDKVPLRVTHRTIIYYQ